MRSALGGLVELLGELAHVRHAHSHLGYFGVLFPLAWVGWRAAGLRLPSGWVLAVYAVATALSTVGFLQAGYGPLAIAGSTVVGAVWLLSAWHTRGRMRDPWDPLGGTLTGVLLAEACIPPIALWLRRDPAFAQGMVATFLGTLLLCVILPSALSARGVRLPWPALCTAGALSAAALGVWPAPLARGGLLLLGALLGAGTLRAGHWPLHLRALWLGLSLGLALLGLEVLPNNRPVAIAAVHYSILGPVLCSMSPRALSLRLPDGAWWLLHACTVLMAGALVAQGLGAGAWTLRAAAIGGLGVALWWVVVLGYRLLLGPDVETR